MELIIKGNMPKGGCEWTDNTSRTGMRYCPFKDVCKAYRNEVSKQYTINAHPIEYFPSDCPILGEIPDEHGRLIDADKLKNELIEYGHPDTREWYYAEVDQFIDEALTIVEATT